MQLNQVVFCRTALIIFLNTLSPAISSPCPNGAVKLTGGDEYNGRVEMCLGGVWGSVCNNFNWRTTAAQVVCRTLGFNNTSESHVVLYRCFFIMSIS